MAGLVDRGWLLYGQRRFAPALAEALRVLADHPRDARTHALCAWCLSGLERFDDAERAARRAIECDPNDVNGWSALAGLFLAQDRDREALEANDTACSLDPREPGLREQRARILWVKQDVARALEEVELGLALAPLDTDLLALRATVLERLVRDEEAYAACKDLLAVYAEDERGHTLRGLLALHRGDLDAATEALTEAVRIAPEDPAARDGLVALAKRRHFVLRRFARRSRRKTDDDGAAAKRERTTIRYWVTGPAFLVAWRFAWTWLREDAELSPWLAVPLALLAACLGAALAAGAGMLVVTFARFTLAPALSMARRALERVGSALGDLVLACGKRGRRVLPRDRLRRSLVVGSCALVLCAGACTSLIVGSWLAFRLGIGLLLLVPFCTSRWDGDARALQRALLAVGALACAGLALADWIVVVASAWLFFQAAIWHATDAPRARRVLRWSLIATWLAVAFGAASPFVLGEGREGLTLLAAGAGLVTTLVAMAVMTRPEERGTPVAAPDDDSRAGKAA